MFIFRRKRGVGFILISSYPFMGLRCLPDRFIRPLLSFPISSQPVSMQVAPPFRPLAVVMGLSAHWSSLLPSWLIYFTFIFHCAHRPIGCHFLPRWPIVFLPLFLSSHGPLVLFLPLIVLMDLLAVTSCHVSPLGFYLFSWALMAHSFYSYLSLCSWAC